MPVTLPIEVFEIFEKNFGREDAKILLKSLEKVTADEINNKWYETKEELKEELLKEVATKKDLEVLRAELIGKTEKDKTELLGKLEKDKSELLGKIEKDKAELIGKFETDKAELLGKIQAIYEKTEKDKAELLGKFETDKAELLGKIEALYEKTEKDKAELLGKIEKDKAELLGKFNRIDLTLKFLIILNIIALTLMNPVAAELIKKLFKLG